ncbi:unnamed protein product [Ostreobium quekettii]|uniref:DDT domain-containing protein n=1 Tax=Ostreobium quekettii TaxID=121088 RepID=A0A8S1IZU8_9CHLO|nr:unnamed protein product [Ostreobium quekettii]|eukprot:evm.model.scf_1031.5 EVM.evm.TU.scf_1031.5   scf_1031:37553-44156(-)
MSRLLYVSDFLSEFGTKLKLRPMHFTQLQDALNGADKLGAANNTTSGGASLAMVYEKLLQRILDNLEQEGLGDRQERRMCCINGPGTWPEVLRRFTLRCADGPESAVSESTAAAAACLASMSLDELKPVQHLELLEFLCDEALNTSEIRNSMQERLDKIADISREMRTTAGEDKRKLRELMDAQRQEKKRKRDHEAAEEAAKEEQVSDPENKRAKACAEDSDSREPCFELPEDIREYNGDPNDRKARTAFRQQLQAEKNRLAIERQRWEAKRDESRKAKEEEQKKTARQQAKAEAALVKERAKAEEALAKKQVAYEKLLDKYTIRRTPLGLDRHHRKYWWDFGGCKPVLYAEDCSCQWASYSTVEEVKKLMESLDTRGVREVELHRALEKTLPRMACAMRKALCNQNKVSSNVEQLPGRQQPARAARKTAAAVHSSSSAATVTKSSAQEQVEAAAVSASIQALMDMANLATACKVRSPGSSWKTWRRQLEAISSAGPHETEAKIELRSCALELETALIAGTGEETCYEPVENEGKKEDMIDDQKDCDHHWFSAIGSILAAGGGVGDIRGNGSDPKGASLWSSAWRQTRLVEEYLEPDRNNVVPAWCMWRSARERKSWHLDVSSATTVSHVAYCILALSEVAAPALQELKLGKNS